MLGELNHALQERTYIEKGRFGRGQTSKSAIGHHKIYQAFSSGMNGFQPLPEFFILLCRRKGEKRFAQRGYRGERVHYLMGKDTGQANPCFDFPFIEFVTDIIQSDDTIILILNRDR